MGAYIPTDSIQFNLLILNITHCTADVIKWDRENKREEGSLRLTLLGTIPASDTNDQTSPEYHS